MIVKLFLNIGEPPGTVAPIQQGYFMLGRHGECQIRPKSSSVSRRHCLILHNEDGVGVLDLESTAGTYVNNVRLTPKKWRVLHHGDEVRCGKVLFKVAIAADESVTIGNEFPDHIEDRTSDSADSSIDAEHTTIAENESSTKARQATVQSARPASRQPALASTSNSAGGSSTSSHLPRHDTAESEPPESEPPESEPPESWQDLDLSEFLSDDDVDDELSEATKRPSSARQSDISDPDRDPESNSAIDDDLSVYVDTPLDEPNSTTDVDLPIEDEPAARSESKNGKQKPIKDKEAVKKRSNRAPKIPKQKKKRSSLKLPSFSLPSIGEDTEKWKLIAAVMAAILVIGILGYQVSNFVSGPEVRVLDELN